MLFSGIKSWLGVAALSLASTGAIASADCGSCGSCATEKKEACCSEEKANTAKPVALAARIAEATGDPYTLSTDPVTGEKLGDKPVVVVHEGRELRFANAANAEKFKASPKAYLEKVDKQITEQQAPIYAMDTCVVAGAKLNDKAVSTVHNNRLVKFCCNGCKAKFEKEPAQYLKKLDEATAAKQKGTYPVTTCVVSDEKLGSMGETIDIVAGGRLVKFCCAGCVDEFKKNPAKYLAKLDAAEKK